MDTTTDRRTVEHSRLTPSQRSQRARIAAQARWVNGDGSRGTQAAREAFMRRFTDEVDPDRRLPLDERERRAAAARKLYFQRMAFARSRNQARRAKAASAERSVVYFLRRGDGIKIGTTRDLPRRVKAFDLSLSDVVATLPGSYDVEQVWHERFSHLRVTAATAEWYRADAELLEAITRAVDAAGSAEPVAS